MKVAAPALLPILRSNAVGDLLARLLLSPEKQFIPTDLAAELGVSLPTVIREVDRMLESGLVVEERIGRARRIQANRSTPIFEPLSTLMALTYGPKPVLERLLAAVEGVDHAFIYGSWAARYEGEAGGQPNDVDVLVVGPADRDELFEIAEQARKALGREVNIRSIPPRTWADPAPSDGFLQTVKSRPLVELEMRGSGR